MKRRLILLLFPITALLLASCAGTDYTPGCKISDSYCENYTGADHYYQKDPDYLRFLCGSSNTYLPGGCPTDNAYAVCRHEDYNKDDGVEVVLSSANLISVYGYTTDECTLIENE